MPQSLGSAIKCDFQQAGNDGADLGFKSPQGQNPKFYFSQQEEFFLAEICCSIPENK
jgi:hypothetical protein